METYLTSLGYPYQRIEGVYTNSVKYNLKLAASTRASPCSRATPPMVVPANFLIYSEIKINNMCIRMKNNLKEIGCTLSHLVAMFTAIASPNPAPYALILEDDMRLSLDVDFLEFINLAPKSFGIIQMMTSNLELIPALLKKYTKQVLIIYIKSFIYAALLGFAIYSSRGKRLLVHWRLFAE
jgi:GR25 family glycosyltransferase involved in LPS biosynthesis